MCCGNWDGKKYRKMVLVWIGDLDHANDICVHIYSRDAYQNVILEGITCIVQVCIFEALCMYILTPSTTTFNLHCILSLQQPFYLVPSQDHTPASITNKLSRIIIKLSSGLIP